MLISRRYALCLTLYYVPAPVLEKSPAEVAHRARLHQNSRSSTDVGFISSLTEIRLWFFLMVLSSTLYPIRTTS